jgi:hypothetical protein
MLFDKNYLPSTKGKYKEQFLTLAKESKSYLSFKFLGKYLSNKSNK